MLTQIIDLIMYILVTIPLIVFITTYKTPNMVGGCKDCGGCGYCLKTEEDKVMNEQQMKFAEEFARNTYKLGESYTLSTFKITSVKASLEFTNTICKLAISIPTSLIDDAIECDSNKEE